jgi:hypothetical protein
MRGAKPLHPNTPSWLGAQLKKHRDNFTFTFIFLMDYIVLKVSRPATKLYDHVNETLDSIKAWDT